MEAWQFSQSVTVTRRALLESAPSFAQIAYEIAQSMRVLCAHADPCDEAAGNRRFVGCVEVDPDLFDVFFNARTGYRGAYFTSQEAGLQANGGLLGLLVPALMNCQPASGLPADQAEASLRNRSAKVWLAEFGKGFCNRCKGEWSAPQDDQPDILNGRWELSAEPKARYGRKAPRYTKLRILGAFVNRRCEEYVATQKRDRAAQIHHCGWS